MEMSLSTSEREELRKLQHNLRGSSDYARVTCILMLDSGYTPSAVSDCLGIDTSTVYRYRSSYLRGGTPSCWRTGIKAIGVCLTDKDAVVYYADGVLPTHNSRSTYAWIEKGETLEQPTVSGRDRVNTNGLLNAHDVTDVIAIDCDSVNAESTKQIYQMVLEKHPDAPEIYIISDNAHYYHNKELRGLAKGTRIRQVFLPTYSHNLNLIERLWKFLRKKVINTGFYRTKEEFRRAIKRFFDNIGLFKEELESLLTLNFRLVNSQTIPF